MQISWPLLGVVHGRAAARTGERAAAFLTLLRRPRCNATLRAQRTCWVAGRDALPRNRVLGSRHVRSWPRHPGGGSPSSRVWPAKEIAWLPPSLYELPAAVSPGRAVIGPAIRHTPHSENEEEEKLPSRESLLRRRQQFSHQSLTVQMPEALFTSRRPRRCLVGLARTLSGLRVASA